MKRYIKTREDAKVAAEYIATKEIGEYGFCVEVLDQTRTLRQNRALHKYFSLLGDALNDAGFEYEVKFLGKELSIPWDGNLVKERIWHGAMVEATGKTSTARLSRKEVSAIYEILARFFSERLEIYVPFPEDKPPMI